MIAIVTAIFALISWDQVRVFARPRSASCAATHSACCVNLSCERRLFRGPRGVDSPICGDSRPSGPERDAADHITLPGPSSEDVRGSRPASDRTQAPMKNQYVGDVNDFCKYGILRTLTAGGATPSTVAWMLTADDLSSDGRKLTYLQKPEQWRAADPDLFDRMAQLVASGARAVAAVEESEILPHARFHTEIVPRRADERREHFARTLEIARGSDLLFFDPDNGLEVSSCAPGRAGSEKYLLWSELVAAYGAGHSVLVYQHFPRRERAEYIRATARLISERTASATVFTFRTSSVVFFLATQQAAADVHHSRALELGSKWKGIITTDRVLPPET